MIRSSMRKQNSPIKKETLWKAPSREPDTRDEANKPSIEGSLACIIDRYNDPKIKKEFRGWINSLVIHFPDLGESYLYKINGAEGIDLSRGDDPNAVVHVTIPSDMLGKLLAKEVNAIKIYSSGVLVVKGEMKHLMQMRKLLF